MVGIVNFDDDLLVENKEKQDLLVHLQSGLVFFKADVLKLSLDVNILNDSLAELDILILNHNLLSQHRHSLAFYILLKQALVNERRQDQVHAEVT